MNFSLLNRIALVLMALVLMSCDDQMQQQIAEEEIKHSIMEQQDAWNNGDIELFMSWYKNSPDISFATEDGVVKGYEPLLNRYLRAYPNREKMGRLEFELIEYIPAGDNHAILVGKWVLYRKKDTPQGYFSLLWERTEDGWKIIHDHTS